MRLIRYWIEFQIDQDDWSELSSSLRAGCGVTGFNQADSLEIIRQRVAKGRSLPQVKRIVEDVDVSTLDPKHVLPNVGNVMKRGIWFPLGYD